MRQNALVARYILAPFTLALSPEPGPLSLGPGTYPRTHPRRRSGRLATGLARRPLRPSRCDRVRQNALVPG